MKTRLAAAGHSSISPLVDITNYVMLELGQPMHVFDRAKLAGDRIVVREAKDGEKMKALDGKDYALKTGQLVIADAEKPVAVAGIMGGEETGVSAGTTEIVFEAASFDAVNVRRTARALNLHSDSSLRFEKGLSTEALPAALARAVELAKEICGAEISSAVSDERAGAYKKLVFPFRPERANELIGVDIPAAKQKKTLTDLGFKVTGAGKAWKVEVPWWRDHDIEGERDLVEEVARVYGYDNLPSVIPAGTLPLAEPSKELEWEEKAKRALKHWGFTEFMTYSFISKALIEKAEGDPKTHLRVLNPLSEDFEYVRFGLLPSMLEAIAQNQEERVDGRAFELSNTYAPREGDLPLEIPRLLMTSWSRDAKGGDVRRIKGAVEALMGEMGIRGLRLEQGDCALFHPGRSARMLLGDKNLGVIGELHPMVLARFGIERRVAAASFDFAALAEAATTSKVYKPIPAFPPAKRDLAFVVDRRRTHGELVKKLKNADPLLSNVELFDVFEDDNKLGSSKSMAYHLEFSAPDRTLTAEEVEGVMEKLRKLMKTEFGAELR
jgi:phenylalanyl-tRNA synthetase beta chain